MTFDLGVIDCGEECEVGSFDGEALGTRERDPVELWYESTGEIKRDQGHEDGLRSRKGKTKYGIRMNINCRINFN